jgi:hypothetical protein
MNVNKGDKRPTMKNTVFKRRSINLDENSYQRGKLLAREKAVSLSALLRILISDACHCHANIRNSKMAVDLVYNNKLMGD